MNDWFMNRWLMAGWLMVGGVAQAQTSGPPSFIEHRPAGETEPASPLRLAQADFEQGVRLLQDKKYVPAAEAFQRATKIAPEFFEAYNNCGIALVQAGRESTTDEQRLQRYQLAADKFSKAAELRPQEKAVYVMWSETLVMLGDLPLEPRMRLGCYMGAVEKCRKAAELAPGDWEIWNKWGVILLTKLAVFTQERATRIQVYQDAAERFERAAQRARFSRDVGAMDANWAEALAQQARLMDNPAKRQETLRAALAKFEQSARVFPAAASTYAMWGSALMELGKSTRLRSDLRAAADKLTGSLNLRANDPGVLYNLACVYTLLDNNVVALQHLKKCIESDHSNTYLMLAYRDPDLEPLRKDPGFNDLFGDALRSLPGTRPVLSDSPR